MSDGMIGLMPRQVACMQVIQELMDATGCCPSYRDIGRELQLKSPAGVHRLISGLVERGYLERAHQHKRGLVILRRVPMPDFTTPEFVLSADLAERVGQ
jgi:SOS-response transcriptional repressor LexA